MNYTQIQEIMENCINIQGALVLPIIEQFKGMVNPSVSSTLPYLQKLYALPAEDKQAGAQADASDGTSVLLAGEWNMANAVAVKARFGLTASPGGFLVTIRTDGTFADFMNIELTGSVAINIKSQRFIEFAGLGCLSILGQEVFKGEIALADGCLYLKGSFNLSNPHCPVYASGDMEGRISSHDLYLAGGVRFGAGNFFVVDAAKVVITYEGFLTEGKWNGFPALLALKKEGDGLAVYGDIGRIQIGSAFIISGNGKFGGPMMYIKTGASPVIGLNGTVSILDMSHPVEIMLSDKGFYFAVRGSLSGLFNCALEVSGKDISNGSSYYIKATMGTDFLDTLMSEAIKFITNAAGDAVNKISYAQNQVNAAKANVESLNTRIEERQKVVADMLAQAASDLRQLQAHVQEAQDKVNGLQGEIDCAKARIDQLKNEISNYKQWLDSSPWWEYFYRLGRFTFESGWRGAEIAVQYARIGTLEAAKFAACTILEGFKQALGEIQKRLGDLQSLDPATLVITAAREVALKALDAANYFLEAQKNLIGGLAGIGSKLLSTGGNILNIQEAGFEGSLFSIQSGNVSIFVKLVFLGESKELRQDINFRDPVSAAQNLARKLLPGT